jgi:hypothetical protein
MLVAFALWRFCLDRLVVGEIAAIHEKSYPVSLAELNRWYPRVPPRENGALVLGQAFADQSTRLHSSAPVCDDPAVRSPTDEPLADADRQVVEDYLDGRSGALALLHEASEISRSRFPIDLGTLSIVPYPHLAKLVHSAHLLEVEAANHADHGNWESAVVSVQSLFALSHSLAREPLVRSHLARLECQRIALDSLQDLLSRTSLADAHLDSLGAVLERADDQRGLARAFIGQRCIGIRGFEMMEDALNLARMPVGRSRSLGQRVFVSLDLLLSSPGHLYDLCGFLEWDELHYLRLMDRYIQTAQTAFPERIDGAQELRRALEHQSRLHAFSRGWLRGMNGPRVILTDATVTARLRAARVAIAVERFRLARGQLPRTLADLDPFGLRAMPIDPFNGRPLRYKRLPSGYTVYSVGENRGDDGADQTRNIAFVVEH